MTDFSEPILEKIYDTLGQTLARRRCPGVVQALSMRCPGVVHALSRRCPRREKAKQIYRDSQAHTKRLSRSKKFSHNVNHTSVKYHDDPISTQRSIESAKIHKRPTRCQNGVVDSCPPYVIDEKSEPFCDDCVLMSTLRTHKRTICL